MIYIQRIKQTWAGFSADHAPRLAAALAYSAVFSLVPFLLLLITLSGHVLSILHGGHDKTFSETMLVAQLKQAVGSDAANAIRDLLDASLRRTRANIIGQILAWVTFLAGASALFSSLQDSLNAVWHIEATLGDLRQKFRDRFVSFAMLGLIAGLVLICAIVTLLVSVFGGVVLAGMPRLGSSFILGLLFQVLQLGTGTLVCGILYKYLPDVELSWSDVATGALVTTLLILTGQHLVALYFQLAGTFTAFGAAGSMLVVLLWIYYNAMVFLLGAEYTKIQATHAATTALTKIGVVVDQPIGVDPRSVVLP